jgi:tRNA (mo5U34)-methyltransferase
VDAALDQHARLREEILRLGPWYLDVEVVPGLTTAVSLEAPPGSYPPEAGMATRFHNPRDAFLDMMRMVYPQGLAGRTVLDGACNCGGYLFWCKEIGAGTCFGSDAREHWIQQARFLQEHREAPTDDMRFEVSDLYALPELGLAPFDIVIFGGIFYHLPDPLQGLRIAASLAKELLIVDTATKSGMPDGMLVIGTENARRLQSGVYGLKWRPTGPGTIEPFLDWLGFEQQRLVWWKREVDPDWGRFQLLASREQGLLDSFDGELDPPAHIERPDPPS